ncbi:diguanylate cyclase (GGDEF)-like protein [Motilibacter peucedani]|uniref:Diguanylate cyclase (GGDEF)-like protein n=1 Tax=Motilibacter peucedani TaxID=598650 RepID=A0A420XQG8_9ACTN|nr:GGDEF domain-containing protein [Motilibacter peucedani]RKS75548.1 diguanylate cyclase (GGDEF)-like protein [Motilibacter peucedani]
MSSRAAVATLVACLGLVAWQPEAPVGRTAYFGCSVAFVVLAWRAVARPSSRTRLPWALLAATLTTWLLGDTVYAGMNICGYSPDISVCDVLWIAGYPMLAAALFVVVRHRAPHSARAGVLDGLTLTSAVAMTMWVLIVSPGMDASSALASVVQVAYPLGDVVVLSAVLFLLFTPGRRGAPVVLLVLGAAVMQVGDTVLSVLADVVGDSVLVHFDAVFLMSNAFLMLAVVSPQRDAELLTASEPRPERPHRARVLFLGAALACGPLIFALRGTLAPGERVALGLGSLVTVTFALARFTLAIGEQARAQRELARVADRDPLTGLANRRVLLDRVSAALSSGAGVLVLYLDLDGFKAVNDEYGHSAGDAVLGAVAERLRAGVRPHDLVARMGGDEFVVLCEDLDPTDVDGLVERLRRSVSEPVLLGGVPVRVGVSIGTAGGVGSDGEHLLLTADAAMFADKRTRAASAGGADVVGVGREGELASRLQRLEPAP